MENLKKIKRAEFEIYEDVRMSGFTNMFDVKTVSQVSGLDKETIFVIMKNYGELEQMFMYDEFKE